MWWFHRTAYARLGGFMLLCLRLRRRAFVRRSSVVGCLLVVRVERNINGVSALCGDDGAVGSLFVEEAYRCASEYLVIDPAQPEGFSAGRM